MQLSLAAAVTTVAIKLVAAATTGSVGFLSDAMESVVNVVAALVALWALRAAARPSDPLHQFGQGKAEYLSAAVEGAMIFVAATAIIWTAVNRLIHPQEIVHVGFGLLLSIVAALINLAVGLALVRVGKTHRSLTLVADGKHLLTDVATSAGVVIGIALVAIFGWSPLDPIVALLVGLNVLYTGYGLLRRSVVGLLDAALPPSEVAAIEGLLEAYRTAQPVDFHALRTRESGRQRFVYLHVLTPDDWTVKRGHDLAEQVSDDIARILPGAKTFAHIEPRGDPASYDHPDLHDPVPPLH